MNGDTAYPPQSVAQQDKDRSLHDERDVEAEYAKIDSMDLSDVETPEFNETKAAWKARSHKRVLEVEGAELTKRKVSCKHFASYTHPSKLTLSSVVVLPRSSAIMTSSRT